MVGLRFVPALAATCAVIVAVVAAATPPPPSPRAAASPATERRLIRFGVDAEFEPFEWVDRHGQPKGFHIDLIRELGAVLDADVDVRAGPWHEIFAAFLAGEIDVVAMAEHPVRANEAIFCAPHTATVSEIFVRAGELEFRSLQDLSGKEVIVEREALAEHVLREQVPGATLIPVDSQADALRLLAGGKHHAAIVVQANGRAIIQRLGLSNLRATGPAVLSSSYSFAVRSNRPSLRDDLDGALAVVRRTGAFDRLYAEWFGDAARPSVSVRAIVRWGLAVGAPLLLGAGAWALWTRSLTRRVARRTTELRDELTQRHAAEQRAETLLAELNHRVRNNLASIITLVRQAGGSADERFRESLVRRVRAMAAAHDAMAAGKGERVRLAGAITMLARSLPREAAGRVIIEGDASLPSDSATPLCLAIGELLANAAEHGPLRREGGGARVRLLQADDGGVRIDWQEVWGAGSAPGADGAPSAIAPAFGLELARGLVEHQLGGRFVLQPGDDGLRCEIIVPAPAAMRGGPAAHKPTV